MKSKTRTAAILWLVVILTLMASVETYAGYTREEAFQYLQSVILGSTSDPYESFGSESIVPPLTKVICGENTVYSPTYSSWLFTIDFNFRARWAHEADLYFIDVNNLSNYTTTQVDWWVENVDMDHLGAFNVGDHFEPGDGQHGGMYQYPNPDPHLKAIIVAAGPPPRWAIDNEGNRCMDDNFWYDVSRWYVMLKYLGYSEITALIGNNGQNVNNLFTIEPPDDDHTFFPMSWDLDGDGQPEDIGNATKQDILGAIEALSGNVSDQDRIFFYMDSHGSPGEIGTWNRQDITNEEFCDALAGLTDAAELYVALEACHGGSMYDQSADILSAQHVKKIVQTEVYEKNNCPVLTFRTDHQALQSVADRILGKTILFTDRDDWSTEEIIYAYRGLSKIEDAFKEMKNIEFLHWQPMFLGRIRKSGFMPSIVC